MNSDNLYPVVILIDPSSASASEIVSGALQDHDRALIVGETSFGKGLVQSVYPLSKNAGLALTTQKWYTPSGRLIQRDYSQISQFDYYNHKESPADKAKEDIKYSDAGRVVYGGGGITPDYIVARDKPNEFQNLLASRFAYFTFVRDFLAKNPPIDPSFQVSDAMLNDFKAHIQQRGIAATDKDLADNRDFLKMMIKQEVFYNRIGVAEAARVRLEADPQVLKALELLPQAKALQNMAKRQVVQQQQ